MITLKVVEYEKKIVYFKEHEEFLLKRKIIVSYRQHDKSISSNRNPILLCPVHGRAAKNYAIIIQA